MSIQDVIDDKVRLPFTSRSLWLSIQTECPDIRRTHAHLFQGTKPSKKLTNIKEVKRYLNVATIASDGLLEDGALTALHIQLHHPTSHQLEMVAQRYLYALDMNKAIDRITSVCYIRTALQQSPSACTEQSTLSPPERVG